MLYQFIYLSLLLSVWSYQVLLPRPQAPEAKLTKEDKFLHFPVKPSLSKVPRTKRDGREGVTAVVGSLEGFLRWLSMCSWAQGHTIQNSTVPNTRSHTHTHNKDNSILIMTYQQYVLRMLGEIIEMDGGGLLWYRTSFWSVYYRSDSWCGDTVSWAVTDLMLLFPVTHTGSHKVYFLHAWEFTSFVMFGWLISGCFIIAERL